MALRQNPLENDIQILLLDSHDEEKVIIVFKKRRTYFKTLSIYLRKPYLEDRFSYKTLPMHIQISIGGILEKQRSSDAATPLDSKFGICLFCRRSKDRQSRTRCDKYKSYMRLEHHTNICQNC